MAAAARGMSG